MADPQPEITNLSPFEIQISAEDSDGEVLRYALTMHPESPDRATNPNLPHRPWLADFDPEHIHPNQEENIEVLSGQLLVEVSGQEHRLTEGDEISISPNTPHRQWNPTDRPIRVTFEHRPAGDSETVYGTLFALAQEGKTDAEGVPNLLQLAVIQATYPGVVYTTSIPVPIQKFVFKALGPIGRAAGYQASHTTEYISYST